MRVVICLCALFAATFAVPVDVIGPVVASHEISVDDEVSMCSATPSLEEQSLIQELDCSTVNPVLTGCPPKWNSTRIEEISIYDFGPIANHPQQAHYLIDFDAHWCLHSLEFRKTMDEIAHRLQLRGDIKIAHVDVGKASELRERLGITGYPAVYLWKKGAPLFDQFVKFTGKRNRVSILSWVEDTLPSSHVSLGATHLIPSENATCDVATLLASGSNSQIAPMDCAGAPHSSHLEKLTELQTLLQRTQKAWSFKDGQNVFVGTGDNSEGKKVAAGVTDVAAISTSTFNKTVDGSLYTGVYFYSPRCEHCSCLGPVWEGVNYNLVTDGKQDDLQLVSVNGDISPSLIKRFNITKYPSFVIFQRRAVVSHYSGEKRRVFDLSTWIQDSIVGHEAKIVKHRFALKENPSQSSTPAPTPSSSPAVSPSPSPSASLTCPDDDDLMMDALMLHNCSHIEELFCNSTSEGGVFSRQICPHTCGSCTIALQDNDEALRAVFGPICLAMGIQCTCEAMPSSELRWCDPSYPHAMSRFVSTLCPNTCEAWRLAYLEPDLSFKDLDTMIFTAHHMQSLATVTSTVCREDPTLDRHRPQPLRQYKPMVMDELLSHTAVKASPETIPVKPTFVLFYDPKCESCQHFTVPWLYLTQDESFKHTALVSASSEGNKELFETMKVSQTPAIAFFPPEQAMVGVSEIRSFKGNFDQASVGEWVRKMISEDIY